LARYDNDDDDALSHDNVADGHGDLTASKGNKPSSMTVWRERERGESDRVLRRPVLQQS